MAEPEKAEKNDGDSVDKPTQRRQPNKAQRRGDAHKKPAQTQPLESPRWWAPTMVTLMVIGLVFVVLTYLFRGEAPIPGLGNWNLAIGFVVMLGGFFMTLRWR